MLLATATSAVAKPKKSTRPVCASALQCARACDGKHKAACDRLWTLVDDRLEQQRGSQIYAPDPAIYAAARTSLPKACGRKNRRACVLLGRLEEQGRGGAGDVTTAARRFGEACDAGETTGCVALGRGYQRGSLPDSSTAKAREAFERACKKKDPEGCYLQGKMIADGIGGAADLVTGIGMIKDACTAGSGGACGALAVMYRYGVEQTIVADASKGREYAERGCDLGEVSACLDAAYGVGDADRQAYFLEACDHGDASSCVTAGTLTTDAAQKEALNIRACELGSAWVCIELGRKAKDQKARDRYSAMACEAGSDDECVSRVFRTLPPTWSDDPAFVYKPPTKKVLARALAELETICARGFARACNDLGRLYLSRMHGGFDVAKARKAYERGCNNVPTCYGLEEVARVEGLEADGKACKAGDMPACARYGRGTWYETPKPSKEAVAAIDRACAAKQLAACAWRERVEQGSLDVIRDSCEAGIVDDCWHLIGIFRDTGEGDLVALSRHALGAFRGALSYDEESNLGHDLAAGIGVGYRLGPWRGGALGWIGHDGLGGDGAPMTFGGERAFYAAIELRGAIVVGRWALGLSWSDVDRSEAPDETRLQATLDKATASGKLVGVGVRQTEYEGASALGAFLYWSR